MKEKASSSGIGFCGMLTILFIGLKLTNYIDWSWWWVLAPLWLPIGLVVIVWGLCASAIIITSWWRRKQSRKRRGEQ